MGVVCDCDVLNVYVLGMQVVHDWQNKIVIMILFFVVFSQNKKYKIKLQTETLNRKDFIDLTQ